MQRFKIPSVSGKNNNEVNNGHPHTELISLCMKNDRSAQFSIYKLYSKAMLNTANRILNNSGDAEDAMQEGFMSAFASLNKYDFSVSFGSWLKKIVINKSIDIYRKKSKLVFTDDLDSLTDSNHENYLIEPESHKEKNEIIGQINQILYEMPDGYRIVFSLNLIEGYDHNEISTILGISETTSRSQLARAKKLLQKKLIEKYPSFKYRS